MLITGVGIFDRGYGKYEKAAMERERDSLWARRYHLNAGEGRRLDELVRALGEPQDNPSKHQATLADILEKLKP